MSNSIGSNGSSLSVVGSGDSLQIAGCIPFGRNENPVDVQSLGTIYYRAYGAAVALLQRALVALGYREEFEHVGYFDEDVQNAVEAFQRREELEVDGVVGPLTWATLSESVNLTTLANDPYIHCLRRRP